MKIYLKNFSFVLLLVSLHTTPMHASDWWTWLFSLGQKKEAPAAQPTQIHTTTQTGAQQTTSTTTQPEPSIRQTPQEEQFEAQEGQNSGWKCLFRYYRARIKNVNPTQENFDTFKAWLLESTDSQPAQIRMELMQDEALVYTQLAELSEKITTNQDLSSANMRFIFGFTGWYKEVVVITPENFKGNPLTPNDYLAETIQKLKSSSKGFFVCIQGKDRTWTSKFIPAPGQSNSNHAPQNYESTDPYVQAALDLCTGSGGFHAPAPHHSSTTTQTSSTTTTVPQTHRKPQKPIAGQKASQAPIRPSYKNMSLEELQKALDCFDASRNTIDDYLEISERINLLKTQREEQHLQAQKDQNRKAYDSDEEEAADPVVERLNLYKQNNGYDCGFAAVYNYHLSKKRLNGQGTDVSEKAFLEFKQNASAAAQTDAELQKLAPKIEAVYAARNEKSAMALAREDVLSLASKYAKHAWLSEREIEGVLSLASKYAKHAWLSEREITVLLSVINGFDEVIVFSSTNFDPATLYPIDKYLVKKINKLRRHNQPFWAIVNSGDMHWICLCIDPDTNKVVYIDSLDMPITKYVQAVINTCTGNTTLHDLNNFERIWDEYALLARECSTQDDYEQGTAKIDAEAVKRGFSPDVRRHFKQHFAKKIKRSGAREEAIDITDSDDEPANTKKRRAPTQTGQATAQEVINLVDDSNNENSQVEIIDLEQEPLSKKQKLSPRGRRKKPEKKNNR